MPKESNKKSSEVLLTDLAKVVWSDKMVIIKIAVAFLVLGVIFSLTAPKEYRSTALLLPEAEQKGINGAGSIGALAGLAGFNLGDLGGSTSISPELYPQIASSTPFLLTLMNEKFYFSKLEKEVSIEEYFMFYKDQSLIGRAFSLVLGSPDSDEYIEESSKAINREILTTYQESIKKELNSRISINFDDDTGMISVTVEMQDPVVVAQMNDFTANYIKNFVIDHQRKKAAKDLEFIEIQLANADSLFRVKQQELVDFKDSNINLTLSSARSRLEYLQSSRDLAFQIFSTLAEKTELARIKMEEVTPVFTTLEPARIPPRRHSPKRTFIVILSGMFGGLFGIAFVFLRPYVKASITEIQGGIEE